MPEAVKALAVVLVILALAYFLLAKDLVTFGVNKIQLPIRARSYVLCLMGMFLSESFWLSCGILVAVAFWAAKKESNPLALYLVFLLGLPNPTGAISGLGILGHLIELTPYRLAALLVLLPTAIRLYRERKVGKKLMSMPEKLQIGFFGLLFILTLDVGTFFAVIRVAFVYPVLDAILVTYVAANTLSDKTKLWDFLGTFLFMTVAMAAIAIFEASWKWLLFNNVSNALSNTGSGGGLYLLRDDSLLRAMASAEHSIVLGYLIMIGLLILLGSLGRLSNKATLMILATLVAGSVATVSRGPWVGAACGVAFLCLVSQHRSRLLLGLALIAAFVVPLALVTEKGKQAVAFLPFIGDLETETIDYRQRLVEIAINVVQRNPFFGAYDFLLRPEFQEMRTGAGIIDIVNTYVSVVLRSGLVGLGLFMGSFLVALAYVLKCVSGRGQKTNEMATASQIIASCLVAMMVTIYTVSSIGSIPNTYWAFIGIAVACYKFFYDAQSRAVT
jgi:O-Antigen ligase